MKSDPHSYSHWRHHHRLRRCVDAGCQGSFVKTVKESDGKDDVLLLCDLSEGRPRDPSPGIPKLHFHSGSWGGFVETIEEYDSKDDVLVLYGLSEGTPRDSLTGMKSDPQFHPHWKHHRAVRRRNGPSCWRDFGETIEEFGGKDDVLFWIYRDEE